MPVPAVRSVGLCCTSDVTTFDQKWHHLNSVLQEKISSVISKGEKRKATERKNPQSLKTFPPQLRRPCKYQKCVCAKNLQVSMGCSVKAKIHLNAFTGGEHLLWSNTSDYLSAQRAVSLFLYLAYGERNRFEAKEEFTMSPLPNLRIIKILE